ncbi:MAG: hypothetical protein KTR31_35970 [Myxococcales bacterium]|nr:hypothetical protein [Myxococcales bacterium]
MLSWMLIGCHTIGPEQHQQRLEEIALHTAVADGPASPSQTTPGGAWLASEVRLVAAVAWSDTDEVVIDPRGSTWVSGLALRLLHEAPDGDTHRCDIVVPLAGYGPSPFAVEEGHDWGLSIAEGAKEGAYSNCLQEGFAASQFDGGDPLSWVEPSWSLFLRGGPLNEEVAAWLEAQGWLDEPGSEQRFASGWLDAPAPYDARAADSYWVGHEMTEEGDIDLDARISFVPTGPGPRRLPTGYYQLRQTVFFLPRH